MKKAIPISLLWVFTLLQFYTSFAQSSQYCMSKSNFPWEQWLERVAISGNNFGNTSGKEGYADFTTLTGAILTHNTGNWVTISPQSSWNDDPHNTNMFWRVWVDFNADGDFTDNGEQVISRQVVIQSQVFLDNEASFVTPSTARLGKTRLRVAMKVGGYPEPCETFERGEVEDYQVEIITTETSVTPDLIPENINVSASLNLNQPQTIAFSVRNRGTILSTATSALIYLSKDNQISVDDVLLNTQSVGTIAPNTDVTLSVSATINYSWTDENAFIIVRIPPLSIESNAENNTLSKSVNINLPPLPVCAKPIGTGSILCNYDNGSQNVTVYIAENNALIRKELDKNGNILSSYTATSLVSDSILVKNNQLIKKLANGSIAYTKNIPPSVLSRVSDISSAVELTDGTFVFAGFQKTFSNDPNPNLTTDKLVLVATNAVLEYQNEAIEVTNSGQSNVRRDTVLQIIPWIDNQFIILYYYGTSFAINSQNLILTKYQKNGATLQKIKSVTDGQKLLKQPFLTFFCGDNLMIFSSVETVSVRNSFSGQVFTSYTVDSLFPVIIREIINGSASGVGAYSRYSYLFRPSMKTDEFSLRTAYSGEIRSGLPQMTVEFAYNTFTPYYIKTVPFVQYDHVVRNSDTTCLILGTRNGQLWAYNPDCTNEPLPDLTLQNLTIPTPSVQQGQVINFAFDIKNIGSGDATNNFTVKSYISKDNTLSDDDIQNGIVPTGNFDAGFAVLQVPGAAIITPALTTGYYYLILKVDADNQIEESNENNNVLVSTVPFTVITGQTNSNYCASKGVAPWELWVAKIQLNTINNESEKFKDFTTLGYSDYTNLSTSINKGQTYLLNITPGLSWSGYLPNVYCRVWIDYNGNKVFESTELVFQNTNVNLFSANIRVPSSAIIGSVKMRIALKWGGFPEPCEVFARGEVEDYTLNIIGQSLGSDTLRLVNITGARTVRQGEEITLNVSIINTGTTPSSPNTPLSIYQNQQPFIFKGPPPTFLTLVSEKTPIGRTIQPNEVVTVPVIIKLFPSFSHITRPDYSQVQYLGTYAVIGNRANNFLYYPYSYPVLDTLLIPYNITANLDNTDLAIQIIAPDTTFRKSGKHSFTVKVTNNGQMATKDVIANIGTGYSQYATGNFVTPTVIPQRGTIFYNTPFGGATYVLWNISNLAPNESLTALVQYDKFAIPAVLSQFAHEIRVGTNQNIDTATANNMATQLFVLDTIPVPHCTAQGTAPWEQWISSIFIASRSYLRQYPVTGKEGYGDFTALEPAKIVRGDIAFLTINPASSWNTDPRNEFLFWRMWIDWNDDGDFDDIGELLHSHKVVYYLGQFFDNGAGFSVPATAPLGRYRLRVAMKFGDYPEPCETFERGEVEDYTVNIIVDGSDPQPLITQGNKEAIILEKKIQANWIQQSSDIEKLVDFRVFPNPAAEEAYIDLKQYKGRIVNIAVSDVAGHIIYNKIIENPATAPMRLDLSTFENGIYFIVIKSYDKRDVVRKLKVLR